MEKLNFEFIDLFAGIGGFHAAMKSLGGHCVFASEIDELCANTYHENYSCDVFHGDIRSISPNDIPKFDVLCAGFPCQPFSKAGKQEGFDDPGRGDLFHITMSILDAHPEVKFIIMENVRNLADKADTWNIVQTTLLKKGFYITENPLILSPTNFNIPQFRERVYILGIKKEIRDIEKLANGYIHLCDLQDINRRIHEVPLIHCDAFSVLDQVQKGMYTITDEESLMINAWEEFRRNVIGFRVNPIWIDYFGLGISSDETFYSKINFDSIPNWKQKIIQKNRNLYNSNRDFIDRWNIKYDMFKRKKLFKKFEWNCGKDEISVNEGIIQIRQSGIRVKRSNYYPSLVAMGNIPIIFDKDVNEFRRITTREAAKLQSFKSDFIFAGTDAQIYKQLGNSVNVEVISYLANDLFALATKGWEKNERKD